MFQIPVSLRWADLDPNFHLRHSVYYDFGATCRIAYLEAQGLTLSTMEQLHVGPIIFREEAIFRKEVRLGDTLTINLAVTKLRKDFSRFSFRHELIKGGDTLCATMHIDGAWLDTQLRKLTLPPQIIADMFKSAPKAADFEWIP